MQNKIKLAILGTRGIPSRYGGFETFAEELSTRLVKRGIEVTVFCEVNNSYNELEYKGVKLKYVKVTKIGHLTTILYDLRCILRALKGYNLIYMLGYGAGLFFWIPMIFKKPIWVNMDGFEWKRAKWPWYGKFYFKINEWLAVKFATLVVADAENIKSYLISKYGKDINCYVIPYGAEIVDKPPDINLIRSHNLEPSDYYLIVCRLEPENHVKEIMEGFVSSKTKKKLIIIGNHKINTPYVRELLKFRDDRIRFMDAIYDRGLLKAIRHYSFAYFHGHSVGGTNPSLLEALGCGNLIIAHDNPFNREVASDCALYFSSSFQISDIINSLELGKNKDFTTKARERIRRIYDWDLITDQYQKLIRDAVSTEL